jgi:hypothetical protein
MECPFCAETVRNEAIVCNHCGRDLRVVRPVVHEIEELIAEVDQLQRRLDRTNARLALLKAPARYLLAHSSVYVLIPAGLLLIAHALFIVFFDLSPLFLRVASIAIPLPFGAAAYGVHRIGPRGALCLGIATAVLAVTGMLTVIGYLDDVPILPSTGREWRETLEYGTSIALALVTGNIMAVMVLRLLPSTIAAIRRRGLRMQDLIRAAGPLAGVIATASGSIYTGLKGMLGP